MTTPGVTQWHMIRHGHYIIAHAHYEVTCILLLMAGGKEKRRLSYGLVRYGSSSPCFLCSSWGLCPWLYLHFKRDWHQKITLSDDVALCTWIVRGGDTEMIVSQFGVTLSDSCCRPNLPCDTTIWNMNVEMLYASYKSMANVNCYNRFTLIVHDS